MLSSTKFIINLSLLLTHCIAFELSFLPGHSSPSLLKHLLGPLVNTSSSSSTSSVPFSNIVHHLRPNANHRLLHFRLHLPYQHNYLDRPFLLAWCSERHLSCTPEDKCPSTTLTILTFNCRSSQILLVCHPFFLVILLNILPLASSRPSRYNDIQIIIVFHHHKASSTTRYIYLSFLSLSFLSTTITVHRPTSFVLARGPARFQAPKEKIQRRNMTIYFSPCQSTNQPTLSVYITRSRVIVIYVSLNVVLENCHKINQ